MHPNHCYSNGIWDKQLTHHGLSNAFLLCDTPPSKGELSPALKHRMAEQDLQFLEVLLQCRGIHTLRSLMSLETTERAVLLGKAHDFYQVLGIFTTNLKKGLDEIFGDAQRQVMNPWGTAAGAMSYVPRAHQFLPTSSQGLAEPLLADAQTDDCSARKDLKPSLLKAKRLVGIERYTACLEHMNRSDELAAASVREAAQALAVITIKTNNEQSHKVLKAAYVSLRNYIIWRIAGYILGMESHTAMVREFEAFCCSFPQLQKAGNPLLHLKKRVT